MSLAVAVAVTGMAVAAIAFREGRCRGRVVETLRPLANDAAADEPFQRAQFALIVRGDEADRVADRVRAARAANPVDVILRVHREIVIHHV